MISSLMQEKADVENRIFQVETAYYQSQSRISDLENELHKAISINDMKYLDMKYLQTSVDVESAYDNEKTMDEEISDP